MGSNGTNLTHSRERCKDLSTFMGSSPIQHAKYQVSTSPHDVRVGVSLSNIKANNNLMKISK